MKKKYLTAVVLYSLILNLIINAFHYLKNGALSFRTPEYMWYHGIAMEKIPPYGSNIATIFTVPAKYDVTQYLLQGIYALFPSFYAVQILSSLCFVSVGVLSYLLGKEVFSSNKLGLFFAVALTALYPLLFLYVGVFTHDTIQMAVVLSVLYASIRAINRRSIISGILSIVFFAIGLTINMSVLFVMPIVLIYTLRTRLDYRVLTAGVTIATLAGGYILTNSLAYTDFAVDVVPITWSQIGKAFLIPLFFVSLGIGKIIKDNAKKIRRNIFTLSNVPIKEVFFICIFIYLFCNLFFMARNIRWVTIPIAFLITYAFKDIKLDYKNIAVPFIVLLFIGGQSAYLFATEDTIEDCINYGVYEKELAYTEDMMDFINSSYEGVEVYLFVEPDRQSLARVYADKNIHFKYNSDLWAMTEEEAYEYCFYNKIDAIFFYPKDYSVEFKVKGERLDSFIPSSTTNISNAELYDIAQENRFLAKMYFSNNYKYDNVEIQQYLAQQKEKSKMDFFERVSSRVFSTDKRYYSFMVFRLRTLMELYNEGVDFSFLDRPMED